MEKLTREIRDLLAPGRLVKLTDDQFAMVAAFVRTYPKKPRRHYARDLSPDPKRERERADWEGLTLLYEYNVGLRAKTAADPPATEAYCLVTLGQAAAMVNRSKRTLERYVGKGLPDPDVEGGGGKPSEWSWARLRPWLQTTFDRELPERFPGKSLA